VSRDLRECDRTGSSMPLFRAWIRCSARHVDGDRPRRRTGYRRQRINRGASSTEESTSELNAGPSAPEGIRTPNLLIRSQMLYPLSYGRLCSVISYGVATRRARHRRACDRHGVAEARGFEPPVPFEGDNSLAVSPIRPLWHASLDGLRVPDPAQMTTRAGRRATEEPGHTSKPGSRDRRGAQRTQARHMLSK
jgi:hypothetical protein